MKAGTYLFWFLETQEERRSLLIPYYVQGVVHHEKLLILGTKNFFQSDLAEEIKSRLDVQGLPTPCEINAYLIGEFEIGRRESKPPPTLSNFCGKKRSGRLQTAFQCCASWSTWMPSCKNQFLKIRSWISRHVWTNFFQANLASDFLSSIPPGSLQQIWYPSWTNHGLGGRLHLSKSQLCTTRALPAFSRNIPFDFASFRDGPGKPRQSERPLGRYALAAGFLPPAE